MRKISLVAFVIASLCAACTSAPQTRPDQRALEARADATIESMVRQDSSLRAVLNRSAGYAVFPSVTTGGFMVSGTGGVGVVYERGWPVGYVELQGGNFGATIGGESYSEIIIFETRDALNRLRSGNFDMNADIHATAISSGTAASATFEEGTAVFIDDESGLFASAAVGGQRLSYTAK